jgi:hypothetical protein
MKRNIALGKKVSNIANSDFVTDGDTEQYDGSRGFGECNWPCDVILDLEEMCTIDSIILYLYDRDNRFYYYNIHISKDNKTWFKIADNSTKPCRGKQIINADQKKARYIKIECLYNSRNRGFHIVQIEVIGELTISDSQMKFVSSDSDIQITHDVFLSYSSRDSKEAEYIREDIEKLGGTVFLSEKSLRPGQDFAEEIRGSIKGSKELWILCSPDSLRSDWVATEWGAAWVLEKLIIPILHQCSPDQLPERLKKLQCIDLYRVKEYIADRFSKKE